MFVLHLRGEFISILQFCFKYQTCITAECEKSDQNLSTTEIQNLFHNIPQWVKIKPSVLCKEAFKSIFYLAFKTKIQGLGLDISIASHLNFSILCWLYGYIGTTFECIKGRLSLSVHTYSTLGVTLVIRGTSYIFKSLGISYFLD